MNGSAAPLSIRERKRIDSHRLIEEFMLLANRVVAERLSDANVPCLYRVFSGTALAGAERPSIATAEPAQEVSS